MYYLRCWLYNINCNTLIQKRAICKSNSILVGFKFIIESLQKSFMPIFIGMKAISLLQPWASLVVIGAKTIETRNWGTKYRGPILIHASQGKAGSIFAVGPPFKKYIPDFKKLPFGAIVGQAMITNVLRVENLEMSDETINRFTMEEKAFGDYSEGRYAWILEEPLQFNNPIPARGTLSIWEYPDENLYPRIY